MRHLVRLVTPPGGTVLDPFTGSGTTGMACKLEGFAFVGIELSADYAALARSRIAGAREAKPSAPRKPKAKQPRKQAPVVEPVSRRQLALFETVGA
jgi:DNA modification methylase